MKTASEMYKYCKDNGFGEGMTENWALKHFTVIANALKADEDVIMCFIGLHNYVSITKHDSNYAYAITNGRILMGQQKVLGQRFHSVLIDNVNDISLSKGIALGVITIDTIREKFNVAVNTRHASNINSVIHDVLYGLRERIRTERSGVPASGADELIKYKSLLDMGAISIEEFETKKRQILGF